MLERAIQIAVEAHAGQKDRADQPYILHPLRVMFAVTTETEQICGVLHDVVEDTGYTFDRLRSEGFSEEVVGALEQLTKRKGEPYDDYISRVLTNPLAIRVKTADLNDNMHLSRLNQITPKDIENIQKYEHALERIRAYLLG
jgi:(p)ppGpp synthase/HD superfamily hydrolase